MYRTGTQEHSPYLFTVLEARIAVHINGPYRKPKVQYISMNCATNQYIICTVYIYVVYWKPWILFISIFCTRSQKYSICLWSVLRARSTVHFYELYQKQGVQSKCVLYRKPRVQQIYVLHPKLRVQYINCIVKAKEQLLHIFQHPSSPQGSNYSCTWQDFHTNSETCRIFSGCEHRTIPGYNKATPTRTVQRHHAAGKALKYFTEMVAGYFFPLCLVCANDYCRYVPDPRPELFFQRRNRHFKTCVMVDLA